MRITSKGHVLNPHSTVNRDEKIFLEETANNPSKGDLLIKKLRGKGDVSISTDELMTLTRGKV